MDQYERYKSDKFYFIFQINKFQLVGGSDYKNYIRRTLGFTFTNEVGILMSWTGQKENFRCCDLKIFELMRSKFFSDLGLEISETAYKIL